MNQKSDKQRNHLANEKSPYLLQHAGNPVNWYPWNATALKKAQEENKPIFVSIGYSTCHWCHVMAHESFEDQDVADRLNNDFVSIKVDREERPDIDTAFMQACQLLNRHGGWPLNLFLTPEGKPFYALTYAPKHGKGNQPGFIAIVEKIAELWNSQPDNLIEGGEQLSQAIEQMENQLSYERRDEKLLKSAADNFIQSFDNIHGGFGPAPKFPQPHNTTLLLRLAQRYDNEELHQMALKTLANIESGGITDQLGGGLHRYSVDEKWLVPHFEKMLYDQALIAEAYLDAWQVSHDGRFKLAAENILDYVLRELRHPDGGFFCGEDADSEGSEGTYYLWTIEQLKQHLSPSETDLISTVYNVTDKGNFEGSNILHRGPSADQTRGGTTESLAELQMAGSKLLQARHSRPRPHRDDKILTGWNGLMISAFARAGQLLRRDDYLDAASRSLSFIRTNLIQNGTLKRRYRDGDTAINAFHEDYAYLIHGLIDLFMVDNDPELLTFALHLTAQCKSLFGDEQGGYYDSAACFTEGMGRGRSRQDGAIPAAASVTAHNLIRLARLTGRGELEEQAGQILALHLSQADKYPTAFAYLLMALDLFLSPPFSLVIVADNAQISPEWQHLIAQFRPSMPTFIVADEHNLSQIVPCSRGKQRTDNQTTAWLCTGNSCLPPVFEPSQLAKVLNDQIPLKTFNR